MADPNMLPIEEPQASPTAIAPSATMPLPQPSPDDAKAKTLVSINTVGSSRPAAIARQSSTQTQYMSMLLAVDTIPRMHNVLASFFTWVLLAGFVIFPGTFTALEHVNNTTIDNNQTITTILDSFKNAPLLVIAGVCCGIGVAGMLLLWRAWRKNYVWLLNSILLPGFLNSLAGLISTIVNVYGQQNGTWSTMAKITAIATGSCMVVCGILFGLYNFWLLQKVRRRHGRTIESLAAVENETLGEKVERKAHEPALEFGSVV